MTFLFAEAKDVIERMISDNIDQLRFQLLPQQSEVEALKSQVTGKLANIFYHKLRRLSYQ